MKLNAAADALPPDKYAMAINIRGYRDNSVLTRPGQALRFATGGLPITDLRAYTSLGSDDQPRILARDSQDNVYLDTGTKVGVLAGAGSTLGATFIPFRPSASANPYMYISNGVDYKKFSAPGANGTPNAVTVTDAGIPEPQNAPLACISAYNQVALTGNDYTNAGTASAATLGTRLADTAGQCFLDPAGTTVWSIQVSGTKQYQIGMPLGIGPTYAIVQDVFQPVATAVTIAAVYYFNQTTLKGRCVIVPANQAPGPGNEGTSINQQNLLASLRRGAIIQVDTELCLVWSVTVGPDGSIAIETSTVSTHAANAPLIVVPAVQVVLPTFSPAPGTVLQLSDGTFSVGAGIGTQTSTVVSNPFANATVQFQPDDYLTFAVLIDNLANLTEMKILFDVGDGTFTENFYFYTLRPSDIAATVANTQTQLAASQIVQQNAIVEEETARQGGQNIPSSAPVPPGSNQWAQIVIPISQLVRVGNDQTKSLQNVNALQWLFNASATINPAISNGIIAFGTYQPDVGPVGQPYLYRVRPRSSVTGARGNPSPATRYGVNPRRESVLVTIANSPTYDPQPNPLPDMDTWDIFRFGGTVLEWRYIGSTLATNSTFLDNYSDDVAQAGDALDFDNFEPWPTVGTPNNNIVATVAGFVAVVTSTDPSTPSYLPGTLVRIGTQNVYTLWSRPVSLGGATYLLQFIENAGAGTNLPYQIEEPFLANQHLPYVWGPDVNGTAFAVGDYYRQGTVSFCKNFAPDSVPDSYNQEITPPSEPLMGGEIMDGVSYVASPERWWRMIFQPDNPEQRYAVIQEPIPRGLAAPLGHCTDGKSIFFWAKDGIESSSKGSLTDEDLYNLFPHEGVVGSNISYGGSTVYAPDYSRAGTFRLSFANSFLYATYQDSTGTYRTLVCDMRNSRVAWSTDTYSPAVTRFYHPEQQAGTVLTSTARYDEVLMANVNGQIAAQQVNTNDLSGPIQCVLATFEFDGGDLRAGMQWGDTWLDSTPAAQGAPLVLSPMSLGKLAAPAQTIPSATVRTQQPVSLGGEITVDFLGNLFTWTDDYTRQSTSTAIHIWQPSFIPKPELVVDRFTDWDDGGIDGAKWVQGFIMHADTANQVKAILVRDADTLQTHAFTPIVQHNGESEKAYSFNQPFIAHMMRMEPSFSDGIQWRLFDLRWVVEPTPEVAETWITQPTTHGLKGFMHVRQISITYASSTAVTLSIGVFDGTAPANITLPPTGGQVQKIVFVPTFNKAQLYSYSFTAPAPFQIYADKSEVLVGQWGRDDAYINRPLVGDRGGDEAKI